MFQRTDFTSQIRQDDCQGSPTPCAEFSGFAGCSECSMRSARFELALLEAQTRSQLEVEFAASAFFTCCSVQLQEPSWKHQVPVSRFDDGPSRLQGTVRRSVQELKLSRMAQRVERMEQLCVVFSDKQRAVCMLQDQVKEIQEGLQKLRDLKEFVDSKTSSQGGLMQLKPLRSRSQELMETQQALRDLQPGMGFDGTTTRQTSERTTQTWTTTTPLHDCSRRSRADKEHRSDSEESQTFKRPRGRRGGRKRRIGQALKVLMSALMGVPDFW